MGCCFAKQAFVAHYHVDIEHSPSTVAKYVVDPSMIMKADHAKPKSFEVLVPEKEFIVETKEGSELIEVLERSADGMHTVTRVTGGPPAAKTKEEVLKGAIFVVHERWELSPHPHKVGHTLLKKTWFDFEQKGNWWVPLLPALRTAAERDTAHLKKVWSK